MNSGFPYAPDHAHHDFSRKTHAGPDVVPPTISAPSAGFSFGPQGGDRASNRWQAVNFDAIARSRCPPVRATHESLFDRFQVVCRLRPGPLDLPGRTDPRASVGVVGVRAVSTLLRIALVP